MYSTLKETFGFALENDSVIVAVPSSSPLPLTGRQ
jgi:hypothetical protein